MPVTDKELRAIIQGVASVVNKQFAVLEARVAALEPKQKATVVLRGEWKPGSYAPNEAVVFEKRLWVCQGPTAGEPSTRFGDWKLVAEKQP